MEKKRHGIVYEKSDEEFIALFKSSHTLTEFGYRLGMLNIGGNTYWILKERITELGLDAKKQFSGWRRADFQKINIPFEEYFAPNTKHTGHSLLERLLRDKLKENRCEECGNEVEWKAIATRGSSYQWRSFRQSIGKPENTMSQLSFPNGKQRGQKHQARGRT
jgi:hypothetical protein